MTYQRPLPTDVLNRELDRAVGIGAVRTYSYRPGNTIRTRRWKVVLHDGSVREMGPGEVERFTLGVLAATEGGRR